jgi:hypothetical protein
MLAFIVLAAAAGAHSVYAANPEFPPDPAGITVIDRAAERIYTAKSSFCLYAILFNRGGHGVVDIYKGIEVKGKAKGAKINHMKWQKIHTWNLIFQGTPVEVQSPTLLGITLQEDREAHIAIVDHMSYQEARVTMYMVYDIRKGTFREGFVD